MTIDLRKIAQQAAGQRFKLFGEQTHFIAAREQTVESGWCYEMMEQGRALSNLYPQRWNAI
jgi:hypothetical protein